MGVAETRKKSVFRLKEFYDKVFILGHLSLRSDLSEITKSFVNIETWYRDRQGNTANLSEAK